MTRARLVLVLLFLTLTWPAPASASWFFGLGAGVATGGSLDASKKTFTGQLGTMNPDGWVGFEFDFGYYNRAPDLGVRTFTGALLVGHNVFGGLRAYGSIGGGLIGGVGRFLDIFKVSGAVPNDPIVTFGGGVTADLGSKFGVRFDVARVMDMKKNDLADPARFGYTRVTGNVYVRF